MLHELQKKLTQVQNSFLKKEKELEKQQCMATELEMTVKEAKQDKSKEVECEALEAEVQKLKNSLEEAKQQQRLAGEAPAGAVPTTLFCGARAALEQPPSLSQRPLPSPPPVSHCRPSQGLILHLTAVATTLLYSFTRSQAHLPSGVTHPPFSQQSCLKTLGLPGHREAGLCPLHHIPLHLL